MNVIVLSVLNVPVLGNITDAVPLSISFPLYELFAIIVTPDPVVTYIPVRTTIAEDAAVAPKAESVMTLVLVIVHVG